MLNRKLIQLKRFVASLLLLTLINQIVAPTVAFALTAGPTAPEATSFEPVDTTDMVNPLTGDFTYNLPLLEVPGPEGGYPLSLSYHAGIQPNEEASWVGLGWTLNPGAITRNVNGLPDDWKSSLVSRKNYWDGGTQTTYNVGVNIGLPGTIGNVGFGLAFSQDTYKGFGVGANISGGIGIASVGLGVSPFGGLYASGAVQGGAKIPGSDISIGLGVGVQTNFESVSTFATGGVNYSIPTSGGGKTGVSLLGASISSSGSSPSFSIGGLSSSTENNKAGNISTSSSGFSLSMPIFYGVSLNLGFSKIRYWSNETSSTFARGTLNNPSHRGTVPDNVAFDSYRLTESTQNIVYDPDPSKNQGGTFPDYDLYSVMAQGLSGNIRPYSFKEQLYIQKRMNNSQKLIESFSSTGEDFNTTPRFRFVNDFSNSFRQNYLDFATANVDVKNTAPTFDSNPSYGNSDGDFGHEPNTNYLAGSKSIEVFTTNTDGSVSGSGFVKPVARGLVRNLRTNGSNSHIAGFKITNSSGVTYHYNLPAYSYGEEIYQGKVSGPVSYNKSNRDEGYAYTWYLTSITGPDYVDRNNNQKLDEGDWGYWVNFEYGKWTNEYVWRNPSEGFQRDEDNEFQTVSMGKKELYYLNAIRTRTHIALFEKEQRNDAVGASDEVFDKWPDEHTYRYESRFGGATTLKLNKIYLLNAADADYVTDSTVFYGNEKNVLTKYDVDAAGRDTLEAKSIRIIDFKHSYQLCKGVPNVVQSLDGGNGKLTLESVRFRGHRGINLMPPIDFQYNLDSEYAKSGSGTLSPNSFTSGNANFDVGDLVETFEPVPIYCGVITAKQQSGGNVIYTLKNSKYTGLPGSKNLRTTKNPPYNKDAYDMWGSFKSDYQSQVNENLSRMTSEISNKSVDVWSLKKINSSLGSEINIFYEGDTYSKSVLNNTLSLILTGFSKINPTTHVFSIDSSGPDLTKLLKVNDYVSFVALVRSRNIVDYDTYYFAAGTTTANSGVTDAYVESVTPTQVQVKLSNQLAAQIDDYGEGDIIEGNLKILGFTKYFGGGLRVKTVETNNAFEDRYFTHYNYDTPGTTTSSGVTTYEPGILDVDNVGSYHKSIKDPYRSKLYGGINNLYAIAREVPPPGVMYEYVTVTNEKRSLRYNSAFTIPGKTEYKYEVFRENMIGRLEASAPRTGSAGGKTQYLKNWVIKKFIGSLGTLKSVTKYDDKGKVLHQVINKFLHDGLESLSLADFMAQYEQRLNIFDYQGLIKERYSEVKEVNEGGVLYSVRNTFSAKEEYPAVPMGQIVRDFVAGVTTSTDNVDFDFYSGALTKMASYDSYGNRFLTVIEPAYRKYGSMGLRTTSNGNKNMLVQEASRTISKANSTNLPLGIISATAQTWGTDAFVQDINGDQTQVGQSNIWRPKQTFQWMPEGTSDNNMTHPLSFTSFSFTGANGSSWKLVNEITRYNVFSANIESKDINGSYSATKLGYGESKAVVTAAPARYHEIAFASGEDAPLPNGKLSTGIALGKAVLTSTMSHTGSNGFSLAPLDTGLTYSVPLPQLDPNRRDYHAAVWVSANSDVTQARLYYKINNQLTMPTPTFSKKAGDWYLLELKIPASALQQSGSTLIVGCKNNGGSNVIYFDDFRFQPFNSPTSSYVYHKYTGQLTYILDNNNLFTRYGYDAIGRLTHVFKEVLGKGLTKVKEIEYNYAKPLATIN